MKNQLIILISLILSVNIYAKTNKHVIIDGLDLIESISNGTFKTQKCTSLETSLMASRNLLEDETQLLRNLLENHYKCRELKRRLSLEEFQSHKQACLDIAFKLKSKIIKIRENHVARSGIGFNCQTENDNSALYFLTGIDQHAGDDQGNTATHRCHLVYLSKTGSKLSFQAELALMTDFIQDIPDGANGEEITQQLSLERYKYEGMYEWKISPKTSLGAGGYFSQIKPGDNSSFGARLQNKWHSINDFYLLDNQSPSSFGDSSRYGGGLIGRLDYKHFEKQSRLLSYGLKSEAQVELGIEAGKVREDLKGRIRADSVFEPFKKKSFSPYIGLNAGAYVESTMIDDRTNSDLFIEGGLKTGFNSQLKNGSQLNIEAAAQHRGSVIKNRELVTHTESLGNQGLAQTGMIESQTFVIQFKATLSFASQNLSRSQRVAIHQDMKSSILYLENLKVKLIEDVRNNVISETDYYQQFQDYNELIKVAEQRKRELEKADPKLVN